MEQTLTSYLRIKHPRNSKAGPGCYQKRIKKEKKDPQIKSLQMIKVKTQAMVDEILVKTKVTTSMSEMMTIGLEDEKDSKEFKHLLHELQPIDCSENPEIIKVTDNISMSHLNLMKKTDNIYIILLLICVCLIPILFIFCKLEEIIVLSTIFLLLCFISYHFLSL